MREQSCNLSIDKLFFRVQILMKDRGTNHKQSVKVLRRIPRTKLQSLGSFPKKPSFFRIVDRKSRFILIKTLENT